METGVKLVPGGALPDVAWLHRGQNDVARVVEAWNAPSMPHGGVGKPHGGLWLSPTVGHPAGHGRLWTHWTRYLHDEELLSRADGCWLSRARVDDDAQLVTIDSGDDAYELYERFPVSVSEITSTRFRICGINWAAVCRAYDGVYLTEQGMHETRLMGISLDVVQPCMYGWDCATVWLARPRVTFIGTEAAVAPPCCNV